MSNYTQSTNFATKDALTSGDPLKIVKGTEINTEFVNISVAIATKADLASPTFTGTPTLPTGTIAVTQSSSDDSTKLATTAFVQDVADAIKAALFPVGSIYTNSSVATNPSTLLGFGTWSAFGAGRVMVGFNSGNALFDTAEETGGSADSTLPSHTHTATSTVTDPSHSHGLMGSSSTGTTRGLVEGANRNVQGGDGTPSRGYVQTASTGGENLVETKTTGVTVATTNASAGSSGTNANYQPYITVYMWKRTA
jgi:hypothetical protein